MNKNQATVLLSRTFNNGPRGLYYVKCQLVDLGQGPYFSIVGGYSNTEVNRDIIMNKFPELQKYVKWNLFALNKGPIHYIANSIFWAGYGTHKYSDVPNLDHVKSTAVWGALQTDDKINLKSFICTLEQKEPEEFKKVLLDRLPALCTKMKEELYELFTKDFSYESSEVISTNLPGRLTKDEVARKIKTLFE